MVSALSAALSALVPDRTGTLLLQSCLAEGDSCRGAWAEFQRQERGLTELFRTDRGELRRLGPLLLHNLRRSGIEADAQLSTVLRTSTLREELRSKIYRDVLEQVLRSLESRGVDSILLGGAALAEWAYPVPPLRHSHDIDLLVAGTDAEPAITGLLEVGFSRDGSGAASHGATVLTHRSSLPVRLCGTMYELAPALGSLGRVREWTDEIRVGEARTPVLRAEAALAYALAQAAFSPRRSSLQWACDAWMICAGAESLGLPEFLEAVRPSRLLLPASILLEYLAGIGAPVSASFVEGVAEAAATTSPLERDLALLGLRRDAPGGVIGLIRRAPDAGTRLALLAWISFPSAAYLRWVRPQAHRMPTPALYLARVADALHDLARTGLRARPARGAVPSSVGR